jgi:hypothetical protein
VTDPITNQEIFNTVVTHFASMKHRSMLEDGETCAYRAPDGNKCAIGVLIPDDVYRPDIEGQGFSFDYGDADVNAWIASTFTIDNYGLLCSLQTIHDLGRHWRTRDRRDGIKTVLRELADDNKLDASVIDSVTWVDLDGTDEVLVRKDLGQ